MLGSKGKWLKVLLQIINMLFILQMQIYGLRLEWIWQTWKIVQTWELSLLTILFKSLDMLSQHNVS